MRQVMDPKRFAGPALSHPLRTGQGGSHPSLHSSPAGRAYSPAVKIWCDKRAPPCCYKPAAALESGGWCNRGLETSVVVAACI